MAAVSRGSSRPIVVPLGSQLRLAVLRRVGDNFWILTDDAIFFLAHILGSRYQRIERWAAVKTVSFHVYWRCESAAGGRSSQSPHALSYNFHDFAHHGYNADEETSWASILREHRKSKNDFGPYGGSIRVCESHLKYICH